MATVRGVSPARDGAAASRDQWLRLTPAHWKGMLMRTAIEPSTGAVDRGACRQREAGTQPEPFSEPSRDQGPPAAVGGPRPIA